MARSSALVLAVIALHVTAVPHAQDIGWSGAWTSRGSDDVQVVRVAAGAGSGRGWNGFVEGLTTSRGYRILVSHSDTRLALDVASTSFSGWWRNGGPDTAMPAPTDFTRRLVLTRGAAQDELLLRVQLSDEKGLVEYIQTFRRER